MEHSHISVSLLRKDFEEVKLRNPHFSMRSYAKRLGISSGALSEIIQGKRPLSLKQKLKIIDKLDFSPENRKDFLSEEISDHISNNQNERHLLSEDQFHLISDWWHFAILNLIKTKGFQPKLAWMSKRLNMPSHIVREAWDRLLRLKYIGKKAGGGVKRLHPKLNTTDDIVSLSIRKAHLQDLPLIENALVNGKVEERHITSVTFPMNKKKMAKAKELIDKFQDDFMELCESDNGDEVFKMSVSLYPLTTPVKKER